MRVLGSVVQPAAHLAAVQIAQLPHRCRVGSQSVRNDCLRTSMAPQGLLQKGQSRCFVALFGNVAFQDLAFVIDRSPQIMAFTIDLHKQASGAGEFHPRALSEPDVTLSRHPAPIVRPYP